MKNVGKRCFVLLNLIFFIIVFSVISSACNYSSCKNEADGEPPQIEEPITPTEPVEPIIPEKVDFYKVRLLLTCTVKDDYGQDKEIICTYEGKTQAEIDAVEIILERGGRFEGLKSAEPPTGNTVGASEYRFVGWHFEKGNGEFVKVDDNTVFDEELVGNLVEITLKVKCERVFSPVMPLM